MRDRRVHPFAVGALIALAIGGVMRPSRGQAQTLLATTLTEKPTMTRTARGTFEVKLAPQPVHSAPGGAELGRMTIDKEFRGDLAAVSTGEMLSAMTAVKGSAGYVAMELVQGTLAGLRGSFVLQHSATMHGGAFTLSVTVVPESGTGELTRLSGKMEIIIEKGQHSYRFDYELPARP